MLATADLGNGNRWNAWSAVQSLTLRRSFLLKQETEALAYGVETRAKARTVKRSDSQKSAGGASYFRVIKELFGAISMVMRGGTTPQPVVMHAE